MRQALLEVIGFSAAFEFLLSIMLGVFAGMCGLWWLAGHG